MASSPGHQVYQVEHLATFSTSSPSHQMPTSPKMALQRLFAMEKSSGIWTQRMAIQIDGRDMKIIDGDSNETVERFPVTLIHVPTAFSHHNHIYDNILIFTVQHPEESSGELHIFQCSSHSAQAVVDDLNYWMRKHGVPHSHMVANATSSNSSVTNGNGVPSTTAQNHDPTAINVKEAVHVFNAIAAQRETRKSTSPNGTPTRIPAANGHSSRDGDSRSITTTTSSIDSTGHSNGHHRTNGTDQSLANERYVSILNHCFDDIERFIIRLQHAAAALRELQLRNHKRAESRKSNQGAGHAGDGLLAIRARGPSEEEFFEILSKFKLAFNLLAKLKGCIHDPNAPELVHFLFTPLAIIIEAARSNGPSPVDPSVVGVPFLNCDAIELLSNCCTSKEFDLWQSLGANWTQPIRQHVLQPSRILPVSFQPVFTDGWAPTITEPELMGFNSSSSENSEIEDEQSIPISVHVVREETVHHPSANNRGQTVAIDDSEDEQVHSHSHHHHNMINNHESRMRNVHSSSPSPIESLERDSPTVSSSHLNHHHPHHLASDIEQAEWLGDLHSRNAKIVKVLFPRTANNDKELTVLRGEILEILDDSRKWWKARNSRGHVAHVPHTIVTEISNSISPSHLHPHHQRSESATSHGSPSEDWIRKERQGYKEEAKYEAVDKSRKVGDVSLQVISSHLFNHGFTKEFIAYLMAQLGQDLKADKHLTPTQVLLDANDKILDKHLESSNLTLEEKETFYNSLKQLQMTISYAKILRV